MLFNIIALGSGVKNISANSKDIGATYKMAEFVIVAVTHCLLIPEIRTQMPELFFKVKKTLTLSF